MNTNAIVQKLWRLCTVLRSDGITYQQYVTELTYLLFLKMMAERNREKGNLPSGMRWADLVNAKGLAKLELFREMLVTFGSTDTRLNEDDAPMLQPSNNSPAVKRKSYEDARPLPKIVRDIFRGASTHIREPRNLTTLVTALDNLDRLTDDRDQLGDLYEGLLQKNAEETKRGAGQYFTPRVLTGLLVRLMQPQPGEIIQDPAAGTGGFLIDADRYMRADTDNYKNLGKDQLKFQECSALNGIEIVPETMRLLLMNLYLHNLGGDEIHLGDALSDTGKALWRANLILTNPPFGPAGNSPTRQDLSVTGGVHTYQLPFVEHCIRSLQAGGRAAIIVPDNVLLEDGRGKRLRQMIMDWCDLHTILRLPSGIFYAHGVKTNVLFLTRGQTDTGNTNAVWVYDLRSQMPKFGKNTPLTPAQFGPFEKAFGTNPYGTGRGPEEGTDRRWRRFGREAIAAREDNLDISWLPHAEQEPYEGLTEPEDIAQTILDHLQNAILEIQTLSAQLPSKSKETK